MMRNENMIEPLNQQCVQTSVSGSFLYRDNSYFNENSEYEFKNSFGFVNQSKANFDKGFWWLNDYYKATSVLCRLVNCH